MRKYPFLYSVKLDYQDYSSSIAKSFESKPLVLPSGSSIENQLHGSDTGKRHETLYYEEESSNLPQTQPNYPYQLSNRKPSNNAGNEYRSVSVPRKQSRNSTLANPSFRSTADPSKYVRNRQRKLFVY